MTAREISMEMQRARVVYVYRIGRGAPFYAPGDLLTCLHGIIIPLTPFVYLHALLLLFHSFFFVAF